MEENKLEIVKPQFNGEITAKIKSFGEIESNMKEVKGYVENLNNYYKNVTFTEETMKQAKDEKSNINKFKKQVADYRKNIIAEYNKPIKVFEGTAKETEQLLTETYNTINQQVINYEEKQKQKKEQEIKDYFNEYKTGNNIDFITYEQARINVTLSSSMKSLKEEAKTFIDKIVDDLKLIDMQEHKTEILVEYKNTLNVSNAITTVINRFKAIEEEKRKQEKIISERLKNEQILVQETIKPFEEVSQLQATVIEEKQNDEFIVVPVKKEVTIKFNLYDEQEEQLKRFLDISNIEYESEDL